MARPAKFTTDDLLDGALAALVEHGRGATIAQAGECAGAPVGSIYHRFPSREHLFVALWLRSIGDFQAGLLATREVEDPHAALLEWPRHIARYCRAHPDVALAMTLYRQRELLDSPPAGLEDEITGLNDEVLALGAELTQRAYGRSDPEVMAVVATAVQQCAYGLVRPHIGAGLPMPDWLEEACVAAAEAILGLLDPDDR